MESPRSTDLKRFALTATTCCASLPVMESTHTKRRGASSIELRCDLGSPVFLQRANALAYNLHHLFRRALQQSTQIPTTRWQLLRIGA
jgi:hypothetical protein